MALTAVPVQGLSETVPGLYRLGKGHPAVAGEPTARLPIDTSASPASVLSAIVISMPFATAYGNRCLVA